MNDNYLHAGSKGKLTTVVVEEATIFNKERKLALALHIAEINLQV